MELSIGRIEEAFESGAYSKEKMEEKIALKRGEQNKIDAQVKELEARLMQIGQDDMEIQKLKKVSAQVKYRIDKYDRHMKKLLCQLLVDKVFMTRTKGVKEYKVHAEVHLRFNPDKLPKSTTQGRTGQSHKKRNNARFLDDTGLSGGDDKN